MIEYDVIQAILFILSVYVLADILIRSYNKKANDSMREVNENLIISQRKNIKSLEQLNKTKDKAIAIRDLEIKYLSNQIDENEIVSELKIINDEFSMGGHNE
jgi:hypothetical protein